MDILSSQSVNALEEIDASIILFEQYESSIMSELKSPRRNNMLTMTHFTLSVIAFAREIIVMMKLMKDLSSEISLRRRVGRFKWLLSKYKDDAPFCPSFSKMLSILKPSSYNFWRFTMKMREFEFKFALKTAITITIMALPAFLNNYQDQFYDYRLNWAMTSTIVVLTPSVGGTNSQGFFRLCGTWAGACIAILAWTIGNRNPYILSLLCFLISIPAFTLILKTKYSKLGQISMLSFSLILLNKYAANADPVTGLILNIYQLALRRGFAVSLGWIRYIQINEKVLQSDYQSLGTFGHSKHVMNFVKPLERLF